MAESEESTDEGTSGSSSAVDSRNVSIQKYISNAKKKRSIVTRQLSKKKARQDIELDDQLTLAIGKMYHCDRRARGVLIRGEARNMFFRKDCTYQRMLEKCKDVYSEDEQKTAEFYIADSRGIPIWNSDCIKIDVDDGTEELEWTLSRYIKISNIKYPSKARFYCVRKECEARTTDKTPGQTVSASPQTPNELDSQECEARTADNTPGQTVSASPQTPNELDSQVDTFVPLFTKSTWSMYRNEASFITNMSQKDVLSQCGDPDIEHLSCDIEEDGRTLYPQNPCAFQNIFFTGIEIWNENRKIDLVEKNCRESGKVIYKQPEEGATFGVWTGGLTYPRCHVALLAAIVTGGFHCLSTYTWKSKEGSLSDEKDPIMYANCRGEFECEISTKVDGKDRKVVLTFCVTGCDDQWSVIVPHCVGVPTLIDVPQVIQESDSALHPISVQAEVEIDSGGGTAPVSTWKEGQTGAVVVTSPVKDFKSSTGMCILQRAMQELSLLSLEDPQALLLLDAIGSGAFGTVHRACWRGTIVAAKVIPTQCKVTTKEVEILRLIHHPHLSSLLGVVPLEGDKIAIITPLVRGSNLHDIIFGDNPRKLSEKEKLLLCIQVCQAIVFLHTNSPVMAHLDIKPANILIDLLTLHATLTDFGLSKVMTNTAQVGTRTMLAGTPGFQPAEQLRAQCVGVQCDVYAFGGVLLVVFTERQLWVGLAPFQIMYKVTVENAIPDTSGLENSMEVLCKHCFGERMCRPSSSQVLDVLRTIKY